MLLPESIKLKVHQAISCRYAVILTYHSVVGDPLEFDIWTHMPVSLFEKHMEIVSSMSNVVPLSELIEKITAGNVNGNLVAITFDDGFRNNFTQAYPILKKCDVPATIFLATDYIDSNKLFWPERVSFQLMRTTRKELKSTLFDDLPIETPEQKRAAYRQTVDKLKTLSISDLFAEITNIENQLGANPSSNDPLFQEFMPLTWKDVEIMEKGGLVSFGGHTASHAILSRISKDQAYNEMKKCKKTLDEHLVVDSKQWAYPNGSKVDFEPVNKKQLIDMGFTMGIMTMEPEFVSAESDIHELGRFGVGSSMCIKDLRALLSKRNRISQYHKFEKISQIAKGIQNYLMCRN